MSESNKAVVIDPSTPQRLMIREVAPPKPQRDEIVVAVKAFSLNRGEIRRSQSAPAGFRPGWDFAGIVEQSAADGSGPKQGARIVGLVNPAPSVPGAWAQRIAAATDAVAELPENVSFEMAATLPVAGLTALHSLQKGGFLLGKKILVTGATGGTGDFTIQLAKLGGAIVVAMVRSENRVTIATESGADHVIIGDDVAPAKAFGPFPLIVDSVGGPLFGKVNALLAPHGIHVVFGTTAGNDVSFAGNEFYPIGMASIYGFILFQELKIESASIGLQLLANLVAAKKLKPKIDVTRSWTAIAEVAKQLTERSFTGKAVLTVDA